jgi:hypothetical protein
MVAGVDSGAGNGTLQPDLQDSAGRQQVNHNSAPLVLQPVLGVGTRAKVAGQIRRPKFRRFQYIRHDDIDVGRHPRVAMLLHRQTAGDEMGMS